MDDRVKEQFNTLSAGYDERRRLLIPHFDEFYNTGIKFLSFPGDAPRVLDIGAGTGIFAGALLSRYPKAKLTLIDFAENMIDIAKDKFCDHIEFRYITNDYLEYDFSGEQFDIIISALSIHHLGAEQTKSFYAKIYAMLEKDGEFLNADLANSGVPEIDKKYDEVWTDFVGGNIGRENEYFERFIKSKSVDKPMPVTQHISWLQNAGFDLADCIYKYLCFAVIYGRK